jgi:molybdopterin converting factor small subunit
MKKIAVRFPPHLRRFIELPAETSAEGATIAALFDDLENQFPGVGNYLLHENGKLRQHVNLFLDGKLLVGQELSEVATVDLDELVIMQALSGG